MTIITNLNSIKPFLSSSDISSVALVDKRFNTAITSSKDIPRKEPLLTDGYGDFILLDQYGPVDKETFKRAYLHMNALLPQIDRTPRQDRLGLLNKKLKQIKPGLQAIFIPRTVYELFYLIAAEKEEIDQSSNQKPGCKLGKTEKESNLCWHSYLFSNTDWKNDPLADNEVSELAFRLNQVLERAIKPYPQGLTERQWIHIAMALAAKHKRMREEWMSLTNPNTFGTICERNNDLLCDTDVLKQVVSLECSDKARNAFLLYRGSKYEEEPELVKNHSYSISFGLSPYEGYLNDPGACAAERMYDKGLQRKYALCIPFADAWQDIFLIPPVSTIKGLNAQGEKFHARARCLPPNPHHLRPVIEGYADADYDESPTKDMLISPLNRFVRKEKLDHYQKASIDFQL